MEKRLLTCLIRDDFSTLVLLYRKLLSTNYDFIGINTAYDRKNQKFALDQDVISSFQKVAYLGPTPIYEDYVTMANFPHWIDLEDYSDNILNIDIMEHLKTYHIDQIFPNQITQYEHKVHVRQPEFESAQNKINNKDQINICLNIFDPKYDKDLVLQYDITYILGKLEQQFNKKIKIWLVGVIHTAHSQKLQLIIDETLAAFNFEIENATNMSLSSQVGIMLKSHLLISGPYGLGFLAYTMKVPSFIVYPFIMYDLKGHTVDPSRNNLMYIETTDEDIFTDLDKVLELVESRDKIFQEKV